MADGPAKRILVVGLFAPTPDLDSGSQRLARLMGIMRDLGHAVTFVALRRSEHAPVAARLPRDLAALRAEGIAAPDELALDYLPANAARHDLILMSYPAVTGACLPVVERAAPSAVSVFDTVDLAHVRLFRAAKVTGNVPMLRDAIETKRQEHALIARSDFTLVVSAEEQAYVHKLSPGAKVHVVPTLHDVASEPPPLEGRADALFIGNFHHYANEDAMVSFTRDTWPLIRRRVPGARLWIVGALPTPRVLDLAAEDIVVTGYVPSLEPYLRRCRAFVAPLRFGAGVKGKVLESLGRGLPAVLSPIAAEGMFIAHGRNALVADGPEAFADAVARLCADDALWLRLSREGIDTVRRHFSFDAARERVAAFLRAAFEAPRMDLRP